MTAKKKAKNSKKFNWSFIRCQWILTANTIPKKYAKKCNPQHFVGTVFSANDTPLTGHENEDVGCCWEVNLSPILLKEVNADSMVLMGTNLSVDAAKKDVETIYHKFVEFNETLIAEALKK
jgi:hypothetical protein